MASIGKELVSLKELTIDHHGNTDIRIFKTLDLLPEFTTLDVFRVFQKVQNSGSSRHYSISDIINAWVWDAKKSKSTLIQLNAAYTFDIDFKILNRGVSIVTT